jgi:hypothetical protein
VGMPPRVAAALRQGLVITADIQEGVGENRHGAQRRPW